VDHTERPSIFYVLNGEGGSNPKSSGIQPCRFVELDLESTGAYGPNLNHLGRPEIGWIQENRFQVRRL